MKHLKSILIIIGATFLGEVLHATLPFPIPSSIYGLLILLLALVLRLVKPEELKTVSAFFVGIMPFLFVAPTVRLMEYWDMIRSNLLPIAAIIVLTTVLVFAISGLATQLIRKRGSHDDNTK